MSFCLTIQELEKWTERVSPYVDVFKYFFEQPEYNLWNVLLPTGKKQIGIEEPTKYRILNKGSIPDRIGRPLPLFQDSGDTSKKENADLFKLFESDHDVELVAENIFVAFEYSENMKRKRWLKAITPTKMKTSLFEKMIRILFRRPNATVYDEECIRLVPMIGKKKLGGAISHEAIHSFIRKGLLETFVKDDEITEEERKAALESNSFKARKKSIPIYSDAGPPTREVSDYISFERCGPAQNVKVLSRGESKIELDIDFLITLQLDEWPEDANTFFKTRKRPSGWPSTADVSNILALSVTASGFTKEHDKEWLLCFGDPYLYLCHAIPPIARCLLGALKCIQKKHLRKLHSGLCSHHMKIAFFWFLENHYSKDWIGPHDWFYKVFDDLLIFVGDMLISGTLNHFFLPGVNILSTVLPDKNGRTLEEAGRWLKSKVQKPTILDDFRVNKSFLDKFLPLRTPEPDSQKNLFSFSLFGAVNSFDKEDAAKELSDVFLKVALSTNIIRTWKKDAGDYKMEKIP